MSRVFGKIEVNGGEFHALFDTGARSSYAVSILEKWNTIVAIALEGERSAISRKIERDL